MDTYVLNKVKMSLWEEKQWFGELYGTIFQVG